MLKIVCDTNVLISALIFPGSKPDKIIQKIAVQKFIHMTSPDILGELKRILKVKFKSTEAEAENSVQFISDISTMIYPIERVDFIKNDPDDNKILECAETGKANQIVSGDKKHLLPIERYKQIEMIAPAEFCKAQMIF